MSKQDPEGPYLKPVCEPAWDWRLNLEPPNGRQACYQVALSPAFFLLLILWQGFTRLPDMAWNTLCSPSSP